MIINVQSGSVKSNQKQGTVERKLADWL